MKTKSDNVTTESTEVGLEGLVRLFEQTQTAMQTRAARSVDTALVVRNWLFGWYIVEFEQNGADRAEYGAGLLKVVSTLLTKTIGKGFSVDNLELMRKFYLESSKLPISETLSRISKSNSVTMSRISGDMDRFTESLDEIWKMLSVKFSLRLWKALGSSRKRQLKPAKSRE